MTCAVRGCGPSAGVRRDRRSCRWRGRSRPAAQRLAKVVMVGPLSSAATAPSSAMASCRPSAGQALRNRRAVPQSEPESRLEPPVNLGEQPLQRGEARFGPCHLRPSFRRRTGRDRSYTIPAQARMDSDAGEANSLREREPERSHGTVATRRPRRSRRGDRGPRRDREARKRLLSPTTRSRGARSPPLRAPHRPVIAATIDGELAGYVLVALSKGGRSARIFTIAVDPRFARRGVGVGADRGGGEIRAPPRAPGRHARGPLRQRPRDRALREVRFPPLRRARGLLRRRRDGAALPEDLSRWRFGGPPLSADGAGRARNAR